MSNPLKTRFVMPAAPPKARAPQTTTTTAPPPPIPWLYVNGQNAQPTIAGNTASLTLQFNTISGDALFLLTNSENLSVIESISLNPGLANFSSLVILPNHIEIWGATNISGAATPTLSVTYTGPPGANTDFHVLMFSGPPLLYIDTAITNSDTAMDMTTNTIVVSQPGDLVLKYFECTKGANGVTQGGWTEVNPTVTGNVSGFIVPSTAGSMTGYNTQKSFAAYWAAMVALKSIPPSPGVSGPFTTGYQFTPTEIVTDLKLADQVNDMIVNYPLLAQAILNSGSTDANALARFSNNMLQLRNADTGLWHSIWIAGAVGAETLKIGPGVT